VFSINACVLWMTVNVNAPLLEITKVRFVKKIALLLWMMNSGDRVAGGKTRFAGTKSRRGETLMECGV
jgi:hypothetical protein